MLSVSTPAIVFVPAVWPFKVSVAESVEPDTAAAANVNVAAAVGLAGVGAKKTQLEIWADPNLSKNTHTILVKSDSSNFKIEIENIQSVENPGTGKITALSVVATLRGMISSLKVGT